MRRYVKVEVRLIAEDGDEEGPRSLVHQGALAEFIKAKMMDLIAGTEVLDAGEVDVEVTVYDRPVEVLESGFADPWPADIEE